MKQVSRNDFEYLKKLEIYLSVWEQLAPESNLYIFEGQIFRFYYYTTDDTRVVKFK